MSDELKPGMTPEEWSRTLHDWIGGYVDLDMGIVDVSFSDPGGAGDPARVRHALASLLLHDQPFGFTPDDVDMLAKYAVPLADEWERGKPSPEYVRLLSLVVRIAALLPPREQ